MIKQKGVKITQEQFEERIERLGMGEYEVVSEYIDSKGKVNIAHGCGEVFETTPRKFYSGRRCPTCETSSQGEVLVEVELYDRGIEYEKEYTFEGLHGRRFDFYLPKYNAVIEFDGKQHFEDEYYEERTLEEIQYIDTVKNQFLRKSGIPFVRIAYWNQLIIGERIDAFIERIENGYYDK